MANWLADFVDYANCGEAPEKILYWVGVGTLAGALRRKVWIDQEIFQWTPNFYIIIVGPPGTIKKSTSLDLGVSRLLRQVPDIDLGPQIVTWQQLVTHMAESRMTQLVEDQEFSHSSVTISISEFGSFFDAQDQKMIDVLTDMWDGKISVLQKETKTNGNDEVVNPWINILACTTPRWMAKNFSEDLIGTGFGSRPIFLYAAEAQADVAYPARRVNKTEQTLKRQNLVRGLCEIAEYAGEYKLTEAAYAWGEQWYMKYRANQRLLGDSLEAGFRDRLQTHLHKLAMVLSASQGNFPVIDQHHLEEANARLQTLDADAKQIFGFVGQSSVSKNAKMLVSVIKKTGGIRRSKLYNEFFFRTTSYKEFEEALNSAKAAKLVVESGDMSDPLLEPRS